MTRVDLIAERRFAALATADPSSLAGLAEAILELAVVEIVSGPSVATMLVELTDSVGGEPFNLGEVVVSEATVTVDGHRGDGLVLGRHLERALSMAICDAAADAGVLPGEVVALVTGSEAAGAARRAGRSAAVVPTRVSFEVLG
jgi:alpha-D-ribose 1-methylphosphonate 5-triphosphate synthase subunit PhnG